MQGPTAAAMCSTRAPSEIIAAMAWSVTPAIAPRHPAWTAPTTPASVSASKTGAQSAVTTPRSNPGRSVTSASAWGRSPCGTASRTMTALGEWIWWTLANGALGRIASAAMRRLVSTVSGSSPLPSPQLSPTISPMETPPERPKKPCGTSPSTAARTMSRLTASAA